MSYSKKVLWVFIATFLCVFLISIYLLFVNYLLRENSFSEIHFSAFVGFSIVISAIIMIVDYSRYLLSKEHKPTNFFADLMYGAVLGLGFEVIWKFYSIF